MFVTETSTFSTELIVVGLQKGSECKFYFCGTFRLGNYLRRVYGCPLLQVAQLRNENTTLMQRLQEISHLHKEASIDNRILKADVEALRAKVSVTFQGPGF